MDNPQNTLRTHTKSASVRIGGRFSQPVMDSDSEDPTRNGFGESIWCKLDWIVWIEWTRILQLKILRSYYKGE